MKLVTNIPKIHYDTRYRRDVYRSLKKSSENLTPTNDAPECDEGREAKILQVSFTLKNGLRVAVVPALHTHQHLLGSEQNLFTRRKHIQALPFYRYPRSIEAARAYLRTSREINAIVRHRGAVLFVASRPWNCVTVKYSCHSFPRHPTRYPRAKEREEKGRAIRARFVRVSNHGAE